MIGYSGAAKFRMEYRQLFIQLFISYTCPFPENPLLLGLETTIHHTSALKFYTCPRKVEQFLLFIPVRVAVAPGMCQYTVHSRSVVQIDGVWVKSRLSKTPPLIAHKSRRKPSFTQCSHQILFLALWLIVFRH